MDVVLNFLDSFIAEYPALATIMLFVAILMKICNTVAKYIPSQSDKRWVRIVYTVVAFLGAHAQDVAKYLPNGTKLTVPQAEAAKMVNATVPSAEVTVSNITQAATK